VTTSSLDDKKPQFTFSATSSQKMIIQNLMNRLGDYIKNNKISDDIDLFQNL